MPISDFVHFGDIDPAIESTWKGKRILSIDVDWAIDPVLEDTLDLIEEAGVKACIFVTHDTPILRRLRDNHNIELGLHPNFDPLIRGVGETSAREIIVQASRLVPDAKVLRSHAMTTSGRWLELYSEVGVTHLSNYVMFGDRNVHPLRQVNGIIEAPVYFADDGALYQRARGDSWFDVDPDLFSPGGGLQVYNFHPIHLFLNCESLQRYTDSRAIAGDANALLQRRFSGEGARSWLMALLS